MHSGLLATNIKQGGEVENQFTVFETLHAQTCNVQGAICELVPAYWPSFAGLIALTALFAVHAYSGAAGKERRTARFTLRRSDRADRGRA